MYKDTIPKLTVSKFFIGMIMDQKILEIDTNFEITYLINITKSDF